MTTKADREAAKARRREKRARRRAQRAATTSAAPINQRALRPRLLIVCEGARTEPNYFRAFPVNATVECTIEGVGKNTIDVVRDAMHLRDAVPHDAPPYTEVWAVFDRDSFQVARFNAALDLAKRERIQAAWSNEAFELWYLMHFEYCDAGLSRTTYGERLTRYLDRPYQKNDPHLYEQLKARQPEALRNAARLLAEQQRAEAFQPGTANPATTVHRLVERLVELH